MLAVAVLLLVAVVSLSGCDNNDPIEPNGPVLEGVFAGVIYSELGDPLLIRDPHLDNADFGDSLFLHVTHAIRNRAGAEIQAEQIPTGVEVWGELEGICIDTDPRECQVRTLRVLD